MFKNKDILIFQILNFSGTYFLYVSFLRFVPIDIFASIASGEIFFGAIGAFLMVSSLRRLDESPVFKDEFSWFLARLLVVLLLIFISYIFNDLFIYIIAFVSVLLTPAHLPIKFGFNSILYILISLKLIFAIMTFFVRIENFSLNEIAFIYFLPSILYGVVSYIYYLSCFEDNILKLNLRKNANAKKIHIRANISHVVTTLLASFISAIIVGKVVEYGVAIASAERLMRSGYSFIYPHLARVKFLQHMIFDKIFYLLLILLFIVILYSGQYAWMYLIVIPVVLDIFITTNIGVTIRRDFFYSFIFLTFIIWSLYD